MKQDALFKAYYRPSPELGSVSLSQVPKPGKDRHA